MTNSIRNHNIKSKADLQQRQDAIQNEYEDLAKEIVSSVLSPVKIAGLSFSLMSSKKQKRKDKEQGLVVVPGASLKTTSKPIKKNKVKSFLVATSKSWLRWQAFNLAYYMSKKAIQHFKSKK